MFYLTLSAISANVLEIRLPITSIYPSTDGEFHHKYSVTVFDSDFRECSQNSRGPPCGIIFYQVCYPFFQTLWATTWRSVAILVNFANLLETRVAV